MSQSLGGFFYALSGALTIFSLLQYTVKQLNIELDFVFFCQLELFEDVVTNINKVSRCTVCSVDDVYRMIVCTRPGFAASTTTRSARTTASSISCVTNTTVLPSSRQMREISSCKLMRVNASSAQWFVHKDDIWIHRQCTGNGYTLLHTPRQFCRIAIASMIEAYHFNVFYR